ncbi:MAG: hypothetical protein GY940_15760, partial [bacterium]|nr:hypothetical protein [bacterium]
SADIHYTWGFPNERAHQFEKKAFGYKDLVNFDEWSIPKENFQRNQPGDSFRKVTAFNDDFNRLWEQCSPGYPIAVKRDKTYLNWRYIERPDWWYFPYGLYDGDILLGYVVLKLYRDDHSFRGHIVDIFAKKDDKETLSRLLEGSLNFFAEQAVDEVTVWILGNPVIESLFIKTGWSKKEIFRPLILKVNTPHAHREKVFDNSNWYFTMGDSTEIF